MFASGVCAHDPQECTLSTALILAPVFADSHSEESGPHLPTIDDFFPPMIWGDYNDWWAFDRIMFVRVVVTIVLVLLLFLAVRKAKLVPGRAQSIVEMGLDFVRVQIAEQTLGKEHAKKYVPMLTVIFFTILTMNLAGVVPFLNIAGTSRAGLPALLALWVFGAYLVAGVKMQGGFGYLKSQLVPPGVPLWLLPLIVLIEALTVFVIRPVTLMLRLVANMMAGHIMLVLCFVGTDYMLLTLLPEGNPLGAIGVLTFAGAVFITLFEVFVAVLQAFIFTLLASIYLNFSLEESH